MIALVLLMRIDYRRYNHPRVVFPVVAVTTLLLIAVFAMPNSHNTHRWFRFGALSFPFSSNDHGPAAVFRLLSGKPISQSIATLAHILASPVPLSEIATALYPAK